MKRGQSQVASWELILNGNPHEHRGLIRDLMAIRIRSENNLSRR